MGLNELAKYLVVGVTGTYLLTGILYSITGDWKHALVFGGYTIANIGVLALG